MASTLSPSEEAQLAQTIEMFEVITQSQPQDYQSLEILKEAYSKLNREKDVIGTSKRIAQAYVQMGQLSSAILEYETILQRYPGRSRRAGRLAANREQGQQLPARTDAGGNRPAGQSTRADGQGPPGRRQSASGGGRGRPAGDAQDLCGEQDHHRRGLRSCWTTPDPTAPPGGVVEPFIQMLADKGILPVDKSLKVLCDKSRAAFLPPQQLRH